MYSSNFEFLSFLGVCLGVGLLGGMVGLLLVFHQGLSKEWWEENCGPIQLPRLESPHTPCVHISCGPCLAQWDILRAGTVGHPHSRNGGTSSQQPWLCGASAVTLWCCRLWLVRRNAFHTAELYACTSTITHTPHHTHTQSTGTKMSLSDACLYWNVINSDFVSILFNLIKNNCTTTHWAPTCVEKKPGHQTLSRT